MVSKPWWSGSAGSDLRPHSLVAVERIRGAKVLAISVFPQVCTHLLHCCFSVAHCLSLLGLPGLASVHRGKVGPLSTWGFVAFFLSCPMGTEQTPCKKRWEKLSSTGHPRLRGLGGSAPRALCSRLGKCALVVLSNRWAHKLTATGFRWILGSLMQAVSGDTIMAKKNTRSEGVTHHCYPASLDV